MPKRRRQPRRAQTKETVNPIPVRVGMTDWNLGQRGDITKIALAREIGLDGIQVSVQYPTDGKTPTLRDPQTQAAFKRAALETASRSARSPSAIPARRGCRCTPTRLSRSCSSRRWKSRHNLGTNNILLPILGDSHIDMRIRRRWTPSSR